MDKNKFFREATLRICGNLEIEKALFATLQYLQIIMPADRMFLEHYNEKDNATHTIALVSKSGGKKVDLVTELTPEARTKLFGYYKKNSINARLVTDPVTSKLSQEMMAFHQIELTSLIVLTLKAGEHIIGLLVIGTEGKERLTLQHADLISLLSEPVAIAMLNTLKHRSDLRLFNRDFFWEITTRICGNLEIEEGLRSCIEFISLHMPADSLYLERHESDYDSMRMIARANIEKGETMDVLIPLSKLAKEKMTELTHKWKNGTFPSVMVINNPQEEPVTRHLLEALGEPPSSVMSLPLFLKDQIAGALVLIAKGDNRFNEEHARLYANLKMPFFVALSNTLKHREIIRLKDLLADDNRYLRGELRRLSGDEIVG
ncbi:MAG: hypothetical protein OEM02_13605, partial [Desulfobulbaceae bacterium]|nr:hypothetical protein [Desulfobulbaceae bacterium]